MITTNLIIMFLSVIDTNWSPMRYEVDITSGRSYVIEQGYLNSNYVMRTIRSDGLVTEQILDSRALSNDKELTRRQLVDLKELVIPATTNATRRSIPPMPRPATNIFVWPRVLNVPSVP